MTNTALDTLSSPSTITADIALLAHKVAFFAAVGSAMSECAYSAVGDEQIGRASCRERVSSPV